MIILWGKPRFTVKILDQQKAALLRENRALAWEVAQLRARMATAPQGRPCARWKLRTRTPPIPTGASRGAYGWRVSRRRMIMTEPFHCTCGAPLAGYVYFGDEEGDTVVMHVADTAEPQIWADSRYDVVAWLQRGQPAHDVLDANGALLDAGDAGDAND